MFLAQISSAFKNFGVSADDRCCLVAKLVNNVNDCTEMDKVCGTICGQHLPLTSIAEFNIVDRIKKVETALVSRVFQDVKRGERCEDLYSAPS